MQERADKKFSLVKAADRLFHKKGYERTSIVDLAKRSKVPAGNVYYYFKTKKELVEKVADYRNRTILSQLARLDSDEKPISRLKQFVQYFEDVSEERAKHGCPIGGFSQEMNRYDRKLAGQAGSTFEIILDWLECQFSMLCGNGRKAKECAVHLLSCLQGAMLLGHTFQDGNYIRVETKRLYSWLQELE